MNRKKASAPMENSEENTLTTKEAIELLETGMNKVENPDGEQTAYVLAGGEDVTSFLGWLLQFQGKARASHETERGDK